MRRTIKKIFNQLDADLPEKIRVMRKEKGLSQQALADKMPSGVDRSTISNWEKGKSKIGFSDFIVVCIICGISPKTFIPDVLDGNDLSHKEERRSE